MKHGKTQLTDDLYIVTYPFSDYITCVEVYLNGQSLNAFCSDHSLVEEWIDHPEQLLEVCNDHIAQQDHPTHEKTDERIMLEDGLEAEIYSFSEDVYCINVYRQGEFITSFCTDTNSINEWQEDTDNLTSIIKNIIK